MDPFNHLQRYIQRLQKTFSSSSSSSSSAPSSSTNTTTSLSTSTELNHNAKNYPCHSASIQIGTELGILYVQYIRHVMDQMIDLLLLDDHSSNHTKNQNQKNDNNNNNNNNNKIKNYEKQLNTIHESLFLLLLFQNEPAVTTITSVPTTTFFDVLIHYMIQTMVPQLLFAQQDNNHNNRHQNDQVQQQQQQQQRFQVFVHTFTYLSEWVLQVDQKQTNTTNTTTPSSCCVLRAYVTYAMVCEYVRTCTVMETETGKETTITSSNIVNQHHHHHLTTSIQNIWVRLQSTSVKCFLPKECIIMTTTLLLLIRHPRNSSITTKKGSLRIGIQLLVPILTYSILGSKTNNKSTTTRSLSNYEKIDLFSCLYQNIHERIYKQYYYDNYDHDTTHDHDDDRMTDITNDSMIHSILHDCFDWLTFLSNFINIMMKDTFYDVTTTNASTINLEDSPISKIQFIETLLLEFIELTKFLFHYLRTSTMTMAMATTTNEIRNNNNNNQLVIKMIMKIIRILVRNHIPTYFLLVSKIISSSSSSSSSQQQINILSSMIQLIRHVQTYLYPSPFERKDESFHDDDSFKIIILDPIATLRLCSILFISTTNVTTNVRREYIQFLTSICQFEFLHNSPHVTVLLSFLQTVCVSYLYEPLHPNNINNNNPNDGRTGIMKYQDTYYSATSCYYEATKLQHAIQKIQNHIRNNNNDNNNNNNIDKNHHQNVFNPDHYHLLHSIVHWWDESSLDLQQQQQLSLTQSILTSTTRRNFSRIHFTLSQQTSLLLYGVALLDHCYSSKNTTINRGTTSTTTGGRSSCGKEYAFHYLHQLVELYPHLSITVWYVMKDRLEQIVSSYKLNHDGGMTDFLRVLEFITTSLVMDQYTAQEVWNQIILRHILPPPRMDATHHGLELKQQQQQQPPLSIRITVLRLLPKLVQTNKKLYRRVLDLIITCLTEKEIQIRLACAVTMSDLAKDDHIRDVSDVIGHIQGLLPAPNEATTIPVTPIDSLLVHYALLSLHYLIIADELDFNVVIQVLKKKLCSINDLGALLKLPLVVLESFVLLLGDGECASSDDDDDKDIAGFKEQRLKEKIIPIQVRSSVQALIHIASFVTKGGTKSGTTKGNVDNDETLLRRVKLNACYSLSRYSLEALGINEEGLRQTIVIGESDGLNSNGKESVERYTELRDLLIECMEYLPVFLEGSIEHSSIENLGAKLSKFEEEYLGSGLWQKPRPTRTQKKDKQSKAIINNERVGLVHDSLSLLPSSSDAIGLSNTSLSTAIVQLLTCDGTKLSILRDFADASIETTDPVMIAFALQGYLNTARNLLMHPVNNINSLIQEILSWFEILVSPDAMYLALSCLSIYIPHDEISMENPSVTFVEDIYHRTYGAFVHHGFHHGEVSKVCLGLLGISSLRYSDIERMNEIVRMLEGTVTGYGAQHSFGAFYALSLIVQAAPYYVRDRQSSISVDEIRRLISSIIYFVMNALVSHFDTVRVANTMNGYLACLRSGTATVDLVELVSSIGSDTIAVESGKELVVRDLFLCCALCLPSLSVVSVDLLVATTHVVDALKWGCGKGLALQPLLTACRLSHGMTSDQLQNLYTYYITSYEERTENPEDGGEQNLLGIDEMLYALSGTYWKPVPTEISKWVSNSSLSLDPQALHHCLLALSNTISGCYCFGGTDIWTLGRVHHAVSSSNAADLSNILIEIATNSANDDKTETTPFCSLILAFLSSIKEVQAKETDLIALETKSVTNAEVPNVVQQINKPFLVEIDFSKLPRSRSGTVISNMIEVIERLIMNEKRDNSMEEDLEDREAKLGRAIQCLRYVSLPGVYANFFVEPLLRNNITRSACMKFLVSQIEGRRPTYVDGKEFVALFVRICLDTTTGYFDQIGSNTMFHVVIQSLPGLVPKIHLENLNRILKVIWNRCLLAVTSTIPNGLPYVPLFLSSLEQILVSKVPSGKVVSVIRLFVLEEIFNVVTTSLGVDTIMTREIDQTTCSSITTCTHTILHSLVQCMKYIPLNVLEDMNVLKLQRTLDASVTSICKLLVVLEFITNGYFVENGTGHRRQQELMGVTTWLSKLLISTPSTNIRKEVEKKGMGLVNMTTRTIKSNNSHILYDDCTSYQRLICSYAVTIRNEHTSSKREIISTIFDVLLLCEDVQQIYFGFQWLSIIVALWCEGYGSDIDSSMGYGVVGILDPEDIPKLSSQALSELFMICMNDLPYHLVQVSRKEKLSAVVANYIHRLNLHCTSSSSSSSSSSSNAICSGEDDLEKQRKSMVQNCINRIILLEHGNIPTQEASFLQLVTNHLMNNQGID